MVLLLVLLLVLVRLPPHRPLALALLVLCKLPRKLPGRGLVVAQLLLHARALLGVRELLLLEPAPLELLLEELLAVLLLSEGRGGDVWGGGGG
jgi:hypothetical protein